VSTKRCLTSAIVPKTNANSKKNLHVEFLDTKDFQFGRLNLSLPASSGAGLCAKSGC